MPKRTIYLSEDLNERLKNENASTLISELLRKHFNKSNLAKYSTEELLEMLKLQKEKEAINSKLEEMKKDG